MTSNVDNRGNGARRVYWNVVTCLTATFIAAPQTPLNAGGYPGLLGQTAFPPQPSLNIIPAGSGAQSYSFQIGALPYAARILRASTVVGIVEAGLTTPTLSVGTASGGTQIVNAAAAAAITTLGVNALTLVASAAPYVVAVDQEPIWVTIAAASGTITGGQFDVILEYAVDAGPQGQF